MSPSTVWRVRVKTHLGPVLCKVIYESNVELFLAIEVAKLNFKVNFSHPLSNNFISTIGNDLFME
jgi:hypothetical protein